MSGPNLESSCPYEILGVDKNATLKHIKLAYRKLALQHHPDKLPPNASESERKAAHSNFAAISNSYEILSDDGRRREHDYESSMQRDNSSRRSQQQQQYQYQQQQRGHHDDFFGGGMFGGGSLFDDPFFASPFGRRQRGSGSHNVQFTDPFEMFERFFQEELGHNRTNNGRSGSRSSSQRMDPFSDPFFSSMGGTGFFGNASQMSASHFGMANSLMSQMSMQQQQFGSGNSGGNSSYSFTSSSSSSGFGGGQSVSTSTRTTIVNGVKQTVTERTVRHPDGRVERFIDSSGGDSGRIASANYPALESEGRRRHR